ncbi:hypothetical protein Cgig2_011714 [Carnegiea gigantea]|uniref:Uncharacterized protein n=1 Tax=Carnegiea gigantea TaxID=171969 RepID=A0A9Q1JWU3_9CARY|nr:hypothetical protein Cgig2_011714 [Carnegiea gigantea]
MLHPTSKATNNVLRWHLVDLHLYGQPNAETEDGITPLLSAVAAGSLACLQQLIEAGAKVNISAGGATPLHIAADMGDTDIINCLVKAGADPNAADQDGQKPIQVAAARGNRSAVEILYPLTTPVQSIPDWTVDGILEFTQSETQKQQELAKSMNGVNVAKDTDLPKQDLPEVSPEAKAKAAEAKARGDDAFKRKDYALAIDAYTQRFEDAANAFYEGVLLAPENKELIDAFREALEAGRKFHGTDQAKGSGLSHVKG